MIHNLGDEKKHKLRNTSCFFECDGLQSNSNIYQFKVCYLHIDLIHYLVQFYQQLYASNRFYLFVEALMYGTDE